MKNYKMNIKENSVLDAPAGKDGKTIRDLLTEVCHNLNIEPTFKTCDCKHCEKKPSYEECGLVNECPKWDESLSDEEREVLLYGEKAERKNWA